MDAARCDDLDVIVIDEEDSVQIDDLATRARRAFETAAREQQRYSKVRRLRFDLTDVDRFVHFLFGLAGLLDRA